MNVTEVAFEVGYLYQSDFTFDIQRPFRHKQDLTPYSSLWFTTYSYNFLLLPHCLKNRIYNLLLQSISTPLQVISCGKIFCVELTVLPGYILDYL